MAMGFVWSKSFGSPYVSGTHFPGKKIGTFLRPVCATYLDAVCETRERTTASRTAAKYDRLPVGCRQFFFWLFGVG
jgi:hypothetical protein